MMTNDRAQAIEAIIAKAGGREAIASDFRIGVDAVRMWTARGISAGYAIPLWYRLQCLGHEMPLADLHSLTNAAAKIEVPITRRSSLDSQPSAA